MEKMIRDDIASYVLNKSGEVLPVRVADTTEMLQLYRDKIVEEAHEVFTAPMSAELIEELGDLLEVIEGLSEHIGISDAVQKVKAAKKAERGGFTKGMVLVK
jgi:predicted house-cleaning noncanonical NTP pyrophosphatase (MazG superfamily)